MAVVAVGAAVAVAEEAVWAAVPMWTRAWVVPAAAVAAEEWVVVAGWAEPEEAPQVVAEALRPRPWFWFVGRVPCP